MALKLRYDFYMWRLIRLTVAGFALGMFASLPMTAQINGVPASVTSIGFGGQGNKISGVPASVTSLGPNGFGSRSPFFNEPTCCINPLFPVGSHPPIFSRHHNRFSGFTGFVPFYTVPYTPVIVVQSPDEEPADDYGGGPTIFDRRGSGRASRDRYDDRYADPRRDERESQPAAPDQVAQPAAPEADQPQTVLVFKDGHQLEVQNYAVIGDMLFDLTPGHRRKIALAELDLTATATQNDDRGIDFELPISAR
jgi:hypothetical protein